MVEGGGGFWKILKTILEGLKNNFIALAYQISVSMENKRSGIGIP